MTLDLQTCSAGDLAQVLKERLGSVEETTKFLKQAIASLENPATAIVTPRPTSSWIEPVTLSSLTPRGKFEFFFGPEGIRAVNAKNEGWTVSKAIQAVFFPKPEDCQKPNPTDLVLLVLEEPITFKSKKPISQVCFALPTSPPVWNEPPSDDDWPNWDTTDAWMLVLSKCLGVTDLARVYAPTSTSPRSTATWQFRSHEEEGTSTTTGGMPFVSCYHGVQDGVLFPMTQGLLFYKPPLWLPRSELASIACGRGGNSRYVDLQVARHDEASNVEFTNLHRTELQVLEKYIHQVLVPAMKRDVVSSPSKIVPESPDESNEVVERGKHRPAKRKASVQAQAINKQSRIEDDEDDEDDDDDDVYEGDAVVEGDDDDEDDDSEDDDGDVEVEAGFPDDDSEEDAGGEQTESDEE